MTRAFFQVFHTIVGLVALATLAIAAFGTWLSFDVQSALLGAIFCGVIVLAGMLISFWIKEGPYTLCELLEVIFWGAIASAGMLIWIKDCPYTLGELLEVIFRGVIALAGRS